MATTENGQFIPDPVKDRAGVYLAQQIRSLSPNSLGGAPELPGFVNLKLPIAAADADAKVLYTVPANMKLLILVAFWEITADWTGGTDSAIGLSSSAAPHSTKGDLLGGSGGDVLASLTAAIGFTQGTIGVSYSAAPKLVVLPAGATVRFDRVVSAFTAGAGFAHLVGFLLPS